MTRARQILRRITGTQAAIAAMIAIAAAVQWRLGEWPFAWVLP